MEDQYEKYHKISINSGATGLRGGRILIDGKPLKGVRKISITADIYSATIVQLEMIADIDAIVAESEIKI